MRSRQRGAWRRSFPTLMVIVNLSSVMPRTRRDALPCTCQPRKGMWRHVNYSSWRDQDLTSSETIQIPINNILHWSIEFCSGLITMTWNLSIVVVPRSKRGKTPLEKVYEKIPQAVSVLLDEAAKSSGYVAYFRTINTVAEIDFG